MKKSKNPLILTVDDDEVNLRLIERILSGEGYEVITAQSGNKAFLALEQSKPDLILLDVMMPKMNGYEVCSRLKRNIETAYIPVIFITSLGEDQDKAKAFAVGGADYIVKPIDKNNLLQKVWEHLKTKSRWNDFKKMTSHWDVAQPLNFAQFKDFLGKKINLSPERREELSRVKISEIYSSAYKFKLNNAELIRYIVEYSGMEYLPFINPEQIQLGKIPTPFCQKNFIVPIKDDSNSDVFVISNPFNWELLDFLKSSFKNNLYKLVLANPDTIVSLFKDEIKEKEKELAAELIQELEIEEPIMKLSSSCLASELSKQPIVSIANSILCAAVDQRASDIHIEPKEEKTVIRFRIDGDMSEEFTIEKKTSEMLISRLKVLTNMNIAERRKPQDGSTTAIINNKTFSLRLTSTSTVHGESLIIRLLDAYEEPKDLRELGMTEKQSDILINLINRNQGLILIVGPTGSGKTTTIYSLLHEIDYTKRSIISVEDPVEYRIFFANQEQVTEKGKVTFETLLKSVVRQDPDIFFLGEVRDNYSATTAMNFASTGHLSITSLHTSNATTAIFRLERLEVHRGTMADSLIGIVAQRLMKKLCPHCKKIVSISEEEMKMLSPYTTEIPQLVAHPVGCPKCNHSGYLGREGIYEIININTKISELIRNNISASEIRSFIYKRGDYLICHHALEKLENFIFTPKEVYENVLVEEVGLRELFHEIPYPEIQSTTEKPEVKKQILIVDDDAVTRTLLKRLLDQSGYETILAQDGIEALLSLGKSEFDLILSDINMPNLDGYKLLEMKNQKGIKTPVIFLTSQSATEDEEKGFKLGVKDYIKKPIQKEILLMRVKNVLKKSPSEKDKEPY